MQAYQCPACNETQLTLKLHRDHVRLSHVRGMCNPRFTCRHCDKKIDISWNWYSRHIAKCVSQIPQHVPVADEYDFDHVADIEPDVEPMEQEEEPPVFEQDHIQSVLDDVKEMFDTLWLSMLSSPGITNHTVDLVCGVVSDMLKTTLTLLKPNLADFEKATAYFSSQWSKTSSEYLRKKGLYNSGDFIQPEKYALNDRMEPVASFEGEYLRLKTDYMAVIPLETTLQRLLECETFRSTLLMPSMFFETATSTHPFCSQRAVNLYEDIGGDYIAIQLYEDDFGTTNPLQTGTASLYKMAGCYFRILNLPAEFQSTFEHTFLAFLAYSNDMTLNRHGFLRSTIVHQLRQLENDGITVLINGNQKHFPVVLFNLVADNLGLNQNGGYKLNFRGDNACRLCHFNWNEICTVFEMTDDKLRTSQEYDEAAMAEDDNVRSSWGLKQNSAFNDLDLFHVQECPSVDLMHDLFQGHVRYLLAMIFQSFDRYEDVFNAVSAFPFHGKDAFNIPRPTQNGDRIKQIKGMTAATCSTLIRLLPLILAHLVPDEGNEYWNLLLLFQKIYDIVMALHATEEMVENLKVLVRDYLTEFTRLEGRMTIKPHYMVHYPAMIKMYGPLRFLWSMRYEAKHQPFKKNSNVNQCRKNLPYTLAWKHQAFACMAIRKMEKADYFEQCRTKTFDNLYKVGDIVVLEKIDNIPQFGRIYIKNADGTCGIAKLQTLRFDNRRHCYETSPAGNVMSAHPKTFYINESMRLYHNKYVRIPFAIP
uniref:C2H2-type domain-containing protein n=1 Tax=Panagrolaimus davidi TaxID=227884 RepID=A0A914QNR8_9BILA